MPTCGAARNRMKPCKSLSLVHTEDIVIPTVLSRGRCKLPSSALSLCARQERTHESTSHLCSSWCVSLQVRSLSGFISLYPWPILLCLFKSVNQFSILSCPQGIQYLAALESLNLYYNCISLLAEVFRLHSLKELASVDLRLNPVVKSEPAYRLFVVRLLPKLRQLGRCRAPACAGGPGGVAASGRPCC